MTDRSDHLTTCPLCGSDSRPDSDDARVRYCLGCGAMLNAGGVDGTIMESIFGRQGDAEAGSPPCI